MTDKVLCPYCGAEMKIDRYDDGYVFGAAYYVCQECGSTSPTANTDAAALSAAQARYLPPNRPLTFDEVNALPADDDGYAPCFLEIEPNWYAQDTDDFDPRLRADAISTSSSLGVDTYGKNYRVWLRKPTQKEMDAAGWGEESNENA